MTSRPKRESIELEIYVLSGDFFFTSFLSCFLFFHVSIKFYIGSRIHIQIRVLESLRGALLPSPSPDSFSLHSCFHLRLLLILITFFIFSFLPFFFFLATTFININCHVHNVKCSLSRFIHHPHVSISVVGLLLFAPFYYRHRHLAKSLFVGRWKMKKKEKYWSISHKLSGKPFFFPWRSEIFLNGRWQAGIPFSGISIPFLFPLLLLLCWSHSHECLPYFQMFWSIFDEGDCSLSLCYSLTRFHAPTKYLLLLHINSNCTYASTFFTKIWTRENFYCQQHKARGFIVKIVKKMNFRHKFMKLEFFS